MSTPSRRRFLGGAAASAASAGLLAALPTTSAQAAPTPAATRTGTIKDVKHVVILMQENRSFDHYYGTLKGVRGFGDNTILRQPNGKSLLNQTDPQRAQDGLALLPYHVDTSKVDGQDLGDLDHSWQLTHVAWDSGAWDEWVQAKSEPTMGYFTSSDIPFHHALAKTFTICDAYHCSLFGPTTPNRLYLWSGMIDPNGTGGGPVTSNPADYNPVYTWTTYPERLQKAGISWQVYANNEVGDSGSSPYAGDYGDNPLWLFQAYHDALASTDPAVHQLADRGGLVSAWEPDSGKGIDTSHVLAKFIADCKAGTLPQVSWVVAPYGYSEHPAARPVDGAAYTQTMLNALFANKALWESTVVLIDYDENDGFFDHIPAPVPPAGTADEYVQSLPIGMGVRVPMTVVSPWSRGGYVASEVFDHTSVIRFLEVFTGVQEPNISAWRRAQCGDLTSALDFTHFDGSVPKLPDTAALRKNADATQKSLPTPAAPAAGKQVLPVQDPGSIPARPVPYLQLGDFTVSGTSVAYTLQNRGSRDTHYGVYSQHTTGQQIDQLDVGAGQNTAQTLTVDPAGGTYDVQVLGANGFLREAIGDATSTLAGVDAALLLSGTKAHPTLVLKVTNSGLTAASVTLDNRLHSMMTIAIPVGATRTVNLDPYANNDNGWYDLVLTLSGSTTWKRRFAGHLENGKASRSGPGAASTSS